MPDKKTEDVQALAVGASTLTLADPALSRTSPLPQEISGEHWICGHPCTRVGAGLLAKTVAHSTWMQADPPPSRSGSLPQGTCSEVVID